MWLFYIVGAVLLLASILTFNDAFSMMGFEETIMQQQYTLMHLLLAGLGFIGAFIMFGVGAVLSAIIEVKNSLARARHP